MKTAVSIPDDLFKQADAFARRKKQSRSHVFSEALRDYLARHSPDQITEAMDRAIAELGQPTDEFVSTAARRTLRRVEW